MNRKHAVSLAALLLGAGASLAQEVVPASVVTTNPDVTNDVTQVVATDKPATLVDAVRERREARMASMQVVQPAMPAAPVMSTGPVGGGVANLGDGGCFGGSCFGETLGIQTRFYANVEYLLWRTGKTLTDYNVDGRSPLVRSTMPYSIFARSIIRTVAPDGSSTIVTNEAGDIQGNVLMSPRLFTGFNEDSNERNGIRGTIGFWIDPDRGLAVEANYFQLEERTVGFSGMAAGTVHVATGFTNVLVEPGGQVERVQQLLTTNMAVNIAGGASNRLLGSEVNLRKHAVTVGNLRIDGLLGVRYIDLDDESFVSQFLTATDGIFMPNGTDTTVLASSMSAQNRYFGPQVGLRADADIWRLTVAGTAKISVGGMNQDLSVTDAVATSTATPIGPDIYPVGTQNYSRTRFSYLPELGGTLGFAFTDNIRCTLGYNVLWINNVVRPGAAAAQNVLLNPSTGTLRNISAGTAPFGPAFYFADDKVVVHGWTFGVDFRF
jgi:hypothetical protein